MIDFSNRVYYVLVIFLLVVSLFFISLIYKNLKYPPGYNLQQLTVSGEGKIFAIPDIAYLRIGVKTEGKDVASVVDENNQKVNKIISEIKNLGINEKDLQTVNYNLSPQYDWVEGRQVFRNYVLNQELLVKVKDFSKIGQVIEKGVSNGANLIGNLEFRVDDPEKYKEKARKIAIEQAMRKAESISKQTGLKLKLVNVMENMFVPGFGGGDFKREFMVPAALETPQIQPGEQEIVVNVNLIYEVK